MDQVTTPRSKKILFSFVLFILVFSVCLVIAEFGIRAFHKSHKRTNFIFIPDFYLSHVHPKNNTFDWWGDDNRPEFYTHHTTNSQGFLHSSDIIVPKPDGVYRIAVLGDSFTEAFQVEPEESYTAILQDLLNERIVPQGRKVEVIKVGVRGHSPIIHYLNYKRRVSALQPDMVVVQMFPNDVKEDNDRSLRSILDDQGLPLKVNRYWMKNFESGSLFHSAEIDQTFFFRIHSFLVEKSRLYEYNFTRLARVFKKTKYHKAMRAKNQHSDGYQFFIIQDHNEEKTFGEKGYRQKAWEKTATYLRGLKDLVHADNAKLLLMYIPIEAQLDKDKYSESSRVFFAKKPTSFLNNRLEEFRQREKIPYLNLVPIYDNLDEKDLYFHWDGHLNVKGHRITAEALYELCRKNINF